MSLRKVANSGEVTPPPILTGYIQDKYNSDGIMHPRIQYATGNNEDEKVRDFVIKNCSAGVAEVWEKASDYAKSKNVRPAFIVAIMFADSSCGQKLSTPNNPGNVHNNDRGNRVGFFTMIEGINAITNTINNKYLSGNNEVWQFSQGGRTRHGSKNPCSSAPAPYKCYATSPENWDNNVMRVFESLGIQNESVKL